MKQHILWLFVRENGKRSFAAFLTCVLHKYQGTFLTCVTQVPRHSIVTKFTKFYKILQNFCSKFLHFVGSMKIIGKFFSRILSRSWDRPQIQKITQVYAALSNNNALASRKQKKEDKKKTT